MTVFLSVFEIAVVDEFIVGWDSCRLLFDKRNFVLPFSMEFVVLEFSQIRNFLCFIIDFDVSDSMTFSMNKLTVINVSIWVDVDSASVILIVFILSWILLILNNLCSYFQWFDAKLPQTIFLVIFKITIEDVLIRSICWADRAWAVLAIVYEWSSVHILVEVKSTIWVILQFRHEGSNIFLAILLINGHWFGRSLFYIVKKVGDAKGLIITISIPNLEVVSSCHIFYYKF